MVYFIDQYEDELLLLYTDGVYKGFQEERMLSYLQDQAKTGRPKVIIFFCLET